MITTAKTTIKPKNQGAGRAFQNPILEKLSRTHILVPITLFSLYSASLIYWGTTKTAIAWEIILIVFIIGLITFTLLEYIMHRYVFHMVTNTKIKEKVQYAVHGLHHLYPKDKDRLAMPIPVSIVLSTSFVLLFYTIMGDYAFAFGPGFLIGYAAYLGVHYIVHAYQPPKNFFKALWVHHGIHHYKRNDKAFGVSSPLWDYVFGTMP